jgi:hypothetical protein
VRPGIRLKTEAMPRLKLTPKNRAGPLAVQADITTDSRGRFESTFSITAAISGPRLFSGRYRIERAALPLAREFRLGIYRAGRARGLNLFPPKTLVSASSKPNWRL